MTSRLQFAHSLLWHSDAWYRRAWLISPQILAVIVAGWVLMPAESGRVSKSADTSGWGKAVPQDQLDNDADALRNRAKTDQAAFESLKAQADLGNSLMQFEMGTLYDSEIKLSSLVSPDMKEAVRYYLLAADQGIIPAAYRYGRILVLGIGVAKDFSNGFPWLLKAANANYDPAQTQIGILYRDGIGVPADRAVSLQWFQKAADFGNHFAEAEIANAYWNGFAPYRQDYAEAVRWYSKAVADPAQVYAENYLGIAYRDGTGVQADRAVSLQWFQKSADSGNHFAEAEIGSAYWNGIPPYRQDYAEAVRWYLKAAVDPEQVNAMKQLGLAYRDGTGVAADKALSYKWFRQGAENGETFSAAEIGLAYWNGTPPYPRNDGEAVKWFLAAAKSPLEALAQLNLGLAYRDARGVARDLRQARYWFEQAVAHGDKTAPFLLKSLP
jgi:TPR repeat protein